MTQTWNDDIYAGSHIASTDLQNMENNFASIKSFFSGTTQPSNAVAGMPWFDMTNSILKIRSQANSSWLGVMIGSAAFKIWAYLNSAEDGWVADGSVTDRVLAIKGGSTYTTGAAVAGSWTGASATLSLAQMPAHSHAIGSNGAHTHTTTPGISYGQFGFDGSYGSALSGSSPNISGSVSLSTSPSHVHSCASAGSSSSHNHGSAGRPAAATGILTYMSL